MKDTGGEVKTLIAFSPRALSGEVVHNGAVIDRKGYESAVFTLMTGNHSGSPTSIDLTAHVQECSSETGSFSDVVDPTDDTNTSYGYVRISGEVSLVRQRDEEINLDLRSHERYIMLTVTPDLTAGSSPTLFFGASVTLGEPTIKPAT